MKFIHVSDLHLGKRFRERSLIEDQKHILDQIVEIVKKEAADAVIIAGDIYDKPVPPIEAVLLLDDFIVELSKHCEHLFVISGNHDSPERLSFGNRLMEGSGVHVTTGFTGRIKKVTIEDGSGPVDVWMLPFIKPIHAAPFYEDIDRDDCTDAIRRIIEAADIDETRRNILIAHQYVIGAARSESETLIVGGVDSVDENVFNQFDYVALGHLHKKQSPGKSGRSFYSGSPLKYSFSEVNDEKGLLVVELREKPGENSDESPESSAGSDKCDIDVRTVPLLPLHEMREVTGSFDELMSRAPGEQREDREAFLRADLTDEEFIPDGIRRLQTAYPNILEVRYPNADKETPTLEESSSAQEKTPIEYLEEFFRTMRGKEMTEEQLDLAKEMIGRIWEEEE